MASHAITDHPPAQLSILLSYLRIAPRGSIFRYCVYASMVLTNACIIGFLTILWTQCRYAVPSPSAFYLS